MIYLDNAATTLKKPDEVKTALIEAMDHAGNAGRGVNDFSMKASRSIYEARKTAAEFFGAENGSCVAFTSNATESLNTAIKGSLKNGDHVITTVMEHNSVLRPLYEMEEKGVRLTILPRDESGTVPPEAFQEAVCGETKMIVCTHGSNVTGDMTDIKEIGRVAAEAGAVFVVDAAQTAGAVPIDVEEMKIDVLCFTGHKGLYGPQGTGGICVRKGIRIAPLKSGGSGIKSFDHHHPEEMPTALEAGTMNAPGIAGLAAGIRWIQSIGIGEIEKKETALFERFIRGLECIPGITIYGKKKISGGRCRNIISINIEGMGSAQVGDILQNVYGISTRTGAHCAPLMHMAIGTEKTGTVRFSWSYFTEESDIDKALNALDGISRKGR